MYSLNFNTILSGAESEDTSNLCNRCNNERCVMQSGICRNNCDFFIAKESDVPNYEIEKYRKARKSISLYL